MWYVFLIIFCDKKRKCYTKMSVSRKLFIIYLSLYANIEKYRNFYIFPPYEWKALENAIKWKILF